MNRWKVLYVHGTSVIQGIIAALYRLNIDVMVYPKQQTDVFLNQKEAEEICRYIQSNHITHVMSIHLIDNLAAAAEIAGVKYISVIWDAPYFNIFTKYGKMPNCYFSVFDKMDCQRMKDKGIPHVLYQPLSVDDAMIREWDSGYNSTVENRYSNDICFVGNLYEDNFYDEFCQNIPQVLQNYFTNIFENAAFKWDGINRVYGTVSDEMIDCMRKTSPGFQMVNFFEIPDTLLFENGYLIRKIANIERICILNLLAEEHEVTIHTTSRTAKEKLQRVKIMPPVGVGEEAHRVFQSSKINLNISLKGIESGTPQRVMDIMGAGGFVITNYCAETAELFEEDKEIVMFRTPEELLMKVDFYLEHEKEREQIAWAGHEKVVKYYTYEQKMKQLFAWMDNMEEMVSIIVPTYNREQYIGRAVQSILRQTYDKYEIIVVDDGSTDNTQEVVMKLQEKDDRIRYIALEQNHGVAHARNMGIQEAKYDYIAFLDSDDEWLPEKLQLQMEKMMESPEETGVVYCRMKGIDWDGENFICPHPDIAKDTLEGNIFLPLLKRNVIGIPSALIRRKCIEQTGGFKESLQCMEDWEWFLRIARNWSVALIDKILVEVHTLPGSVSMNEGAAIITRCYLVSLYREEMRRAGSLDSISEEILRFAKNYGAREEIEELLGRDFEL